MAFGKWSGRHVPVETSVDSNDVNLIQAGVMQISIVCNDIKVGAPPIGPIMALKKEKNCVVGMKVQIYLAICNVGFIPRFWQY